MHSVDSLSDVYSNRPFDKVFEAIRKVEAYLAPVFADTGPSPFSPNEDIPVPPTTMERILRLYRDGYPVGQIAKAVGLPGDAVSRHIRSEATPRKTD